METISLEGKTNFFEKKVHSVFVFVFSNLHIYLCILKYSYLFLYFQMFTYLVLRLPNTQRWVLWETRRMLSSAWMPTSRASPDILASRDLATSRANHDISASRDLALQILLCHNMNSEFTFFLPALAQYHRRRNCLVL